MRYMITFNQVEGVWEELNEAEQTRHAAQLGALIGALKANGSELVFLAPPGQAATVRMHPDGLVETLDGPARPGFEQAGGYYVVDVDSLEEAIEWARRGRFLAGSSEVRQIIDFPE
ncbi:YciI family protein [Phenylobacterium sp.]|uniref:YciI family protein n=1 Tax=Phenylobacterium sp. TaxID=1871053 RepID=UPI0035B26960